MNFFNLKKITKIYLSASIFIFSAGILPAQTSASALRAQLSSGSSSKVGQQTNETPDAQLAMSVSNYPVTAGDVYTLAFAAGSTPISYSIPVDSTYKIRIANLGVVNCKGLTYLQLKNQVTSIVQKNYPMGGVQFVLTSPATFLVTVAGEVQKTVQKNAWALTRLSSIVKDGLTEYSSKRNIKIISEDGTEKTYDLFLADRKGDLSQDPYLRPGDRIEVNRISRKVTLKGAVERPGIYELLDGENLKELIDNYGNGLASLADLSRIELYREKTDAANSGEKIYLDEQAYKDDYALLCYDSVYVSSYKDLKPVIYVEGAVNSAGILKTDAADSAGATPVENVVLMDDAKTVSTDENLNASTKISVQFNVGEDYAFFIRRYKEMFTSVSDLENSYILRDGEHIPVNISQILYDENFKTKIEMKANDVLLVPFRQFFVSVSGAVASPGRYPYIPDRTYDYYVGLAGGFLRERNKGDAVVITDTDGKKHKKSEFILPEMTIEAKSNSGLYYFNQYAPVVSTILSALATSLSAYAVINSL